MVDGPVVGLAAATATPPGNPPAPAISVPRDSSPRFRPGSPVRGTTPCETSNGPGAANHSPVPSAWVTSTRPSATSASVASRMMRTLGFARSLGTARILARRPDSGAICVWAPTNKTAVPQEARVSATDIPTASAPQMVQAAGAGADSPATSQSRMSRTWAPSLAGTLICGRSPSVARTRASAVSPSARASSGSLQKTECRVR